MKDSALDRKRSTGKTASAHPAATTKKKKAAPLGIQRNRSADPSRKITARFFRLLEMVQRGNYPKNGDEIAR